MKKFSYDGFFTENSEDLELGVVEHAKYDFAVAYPSHETLPMDSLTGFISPAKNNATCIGSKFGQLYMVPVSVN